MKPLRLAFKLLAAFLLLVVLLVGAGVVLVNTKAFQQRVLKQTTQMLSERLQTQVSIDSVDIRFMAQQLRLYGLHVADQQQRPLLTVRQAGVDVDMYPTSSSSSMPLKSTPRPNVIPLWRPASVSSSISTACA